MFTYVCICVYVCVCVSAVSLCTTHFLRSQVRSCLEIKSENCIHTLMESALLMRGNNLSFSKAGIETTDYAIFTHE